MKISIIVPIFNQEKYLQTAIDSVKNQTIGFENIELILVDDCSTDRSKEIIINNAKKHDNIKPIFLDTNSGGAAIPKNTGIKNATSPFLMFLDPDDCLLEDVCELLYDKIVDEDADIVTGNAVVLANDGLYYDLDYGDVLEETIYPTKDYSKFKGYRVWGSLFKRNFILDNDISFLNRKTNEDTYFQQKASFRASKICYLNDYYGYIYFVRNESNSLSNTYNKQSLISTFDAFLNIKKMLVEENVKLSHDPFLINLFTRFGADWDVTIEEEREVFKKILEYENEFKLPLKLPIWYKVANYLLLKNHFKLLHYFHTCFSKLSKSKFIKSIFNPHNKIKPEDKIYNKVKKTLSKL